MHEFSLYVHIPYCQAKCAYCDFNSYAAEHWPEARYIAALGTELTTYAASDAWSDGCINTIFFGGGTPSLFSAASIAAVLTAATDRWALASDAEITVEANPGTVTADKLAGLRAAGVTRMSFGVQSFTARHLQTLGRIHDADEARAAVRMARAAGFTNISIDLMYGLPNQTVEEWERDLAEGCALEPDHISAYNLTYEDGTPFHRWRAQGLLQQLPEEIEIAMFGNTQTRLLAAGYDHYEISNYAQPGKACRHNLNYWHSGNYLGIGAGAHSYTAHTGAHGMRWANEKNPAAYIAAVEQRSEARTSTEALEERQARGEFVFLGLRCRNGFTAEAFQRRFGIDLPTAFPRVADFIAEGLLEFTDGYWRLTPHGSLLADSIFVAFL